MSATDWQISRGWRVTLGPGVAAFDVGGLDTDDNLLFSAGSPGLLTHHSGAWDRVDCKFEAGSSEAVAIGVLPTDQDFKITIALGSAKKLTASVEPGKAGVGGKVPAGGSWTAVEDGGEPVFTG
ncbi:MAG: hypothetical protein U0002_09510 [Thermoanaerobaculia bacterium]